MSLFGRLLDVLFPPRETEALVRASSIDDLHALVAPTAIELSGVPATTLLPYRTLAKAAVIEAKYHDSALARAILASVLAEYLQGITDDEGGLSGPLALAPIPLSDKRFKERGYNQVERICQDALAKLDSTLHYAPHALRRVRDTAPQTKLSGEARRENMKGAFLAAPELDTTYTYIVVDDVITTGATLSAAISALQDAGAAVIPIALAR